LYCRTVDEGDA
jgi:hypothetical protein